MKLYPISIQALFETHSGVPLPALDRLRESFEALVKTVERVAPVFEEAVRFAAEHPHDKIVAALRASLEKS